MWLSTQRSSGRWRQPYGRGSLTFVFSSPAANVGRPLMSQTPWCRCSTSTPGILPFVYSRLGRKPTIQPARFGRGTLSPSNEIVFWPGWIASGPKRYLMCWTRGAADAAAGRASNASTTAAMSRGSTLLTVDGRRMVYVAVRMRRVWTLLVVLTVLMAGASTALAHPERQSFFPDASKGAVPKYRHARPPLVVCKRNSRALVRKIFKGRSRAQTKRQRLRTLKKCRFRHIQAAVNAAKQQRPHPDHAGRLPGGAQPQGPGRPVQVRGHVRDARRRRREGRRRSSTRSSARTRAT